MKRILSLIVLIVVLGIIALALKSLGETMKLRGNPLSPSPQPTASPTASTEPMGSVYGNPTNFSYAGKLVFVRPGDNTSVPTLVYLANGAIPATSTLLFDELSACAAPNGSEPCMALNTPLEIILNGKNAVVEGLHQINGVLVRKLLVTEVVDHEHKPPLGRVFISWPQARELIKSCAPRTILQTHDLDVNLHMPNGSVLVSVEPVIDEVMDVVNEARAVCGVIPVATE